MILNLVCLSTGSRGDSIQLISGADSKNGISRIHEIFPAQGVFQIENPELQNENRIPRLQDRAAIKI